VDQAVAVPIASPDHRAGRRVSYAALYIKEVFVGLFDDISAKVTSALGADAQHAGLVSHALDLLKGGQAGGLQGLVQAFENNGMGHIVASWIGTGANLPVTAAQIQTALGSAQIQQLAAKAGISTDAVAAGLSKILPHLVDHLTPNGQLPAPGNLVDQAAGFLKGKLA
jgi:uncharacterized protein YidB (DUF937 family)